MIRYNIYRIVSYIISHHISYHIMSYIISYHIYHIISYHLSYRIVTIIIIEIVIKIHFPLIATFLTLVFLSSFLPKYSRQQLPPPAFFSQVFFLRARDRVSHPCETSNRIIRNVRYMHPEYRVWPPQVFQVRVWEVEFCTFLLFLDFFCVCVF
jgi:hypothetical protein